MNTVNTKYGVFLPYSGASDLRKKYRMPVEYYKSGKVRSIYLEEPVTVSLPSGEYQAELITFYEDGNIKRIFPLYGQISAYWSIEDELESAPYYMFRFKDNDISIRPQCLFFYPSGKIRSITLWPDDEVTVKTPSGEIRTALGVELYESGSIRSIEPVFGTTVSTPAGEARPYVYKAMMLHAENASLVFSENGKIERLKTLKSVLDVNGTEYSSQGYRSPLTVRFEDNEVVIVRQNDSDIRIDTLQNEVRFR